MGVQNRNRLLVSLSLVLLLAFSSNSQNKQDKLRSSPPPLASDDVICILSTEVLVENVSVKDEKNVFLSGLTADDFIISKKGKKTPDYFVVSQMPMGKSRSNESPGLPNQQTVYSVGQVLDCICAPSGDQALLRKIEWKKIRRNFKVDLSEKKKKELGKFLIVQVNRNTEKH